MEVGGEALLYDEFIAYICLAHRQPAHHDHGEQIMNSEKRNTKIFNILSIVFLAAIVLTIVGGVTMQQLDMSSRVGEKGGGRGHNFLQPGLTQTSPTGELVLTTGIILLAIGFVITVLMLLVRRNRLHRNPA
jgi:preprotein translocase subunit SecG